MRRAIGSILFAALALSPAASPAQTAAVRPADTRHGAEAALVHRIVASGAVPGMVIYTRQGDAAPHLVAEGTIATAPDAPRADADSLWRLYSMTKPVTGIAAMILIEEGKLRLDQPISDFLPAFRNMRVLVDPAKSLETRPATRPITVRNLLTHTAGLGYNIITRGPLLDEYNRLGINPAQVSAQMEPQMRSVRQKSLAAFADALAPLPLIAEPGTQWSYSIGLDLLGRVIEVASGMAFDTFVTTRILQPLGMTSTYWTVPADQAGRFADNYGGPGIVVDAGATSVYLTPPSFPYGGAGLVGSARDYERFLAMLVRGGALDGRRILKPATVRLAMSDLLPKGVDRTLLQGMAGNGVPMGFGAGGSVYLADLPGGPAKGTFGWAGAAGTLGWADPANRLSAVVMVNSFAGPIAKGAAARAIYADLTH